MKKLFTAVFFFLIVISSAAYAGSFNSTFGPDEKVINSGDTLQTGKTVSSGFYVIGKEPAVDIAQNSQPLTDKSTSPVEKKADTLPNSKENREQALLELSEFLCGLRSCVGECTDMKCIMQQMYFYTR